MQSRYLAWFAPTGPLLFHCRVRLLLPPWHPSGVPVVPKPAAVTDNGSSFTQAGFAGQKAKFVLRTVMLHLCSAGMMWETEQLPSTAESTAGFAVAPRTHPLKHSIIEDWDRMEKPVEPPLLWPESPPRKTAHAHGRLPFLPLHQQGEVGRGAFWGARPAHG